MRRCRPQAKCDTTSGMIDAMGLLFGAILRLFRARRSLLLENLALRQQLAALKRSHPRPRRAALDKVFWVLARKFWSGWKQALIVVSPETVVRWHRSDSHSIGAPSPKPTGWSAGGECRKRFAI
jgi:hypothetical protein